MAAFPVALRAARRLLILGTARIEEALLPLTALAQQPRGEPVGVH
ncbi:MAG: hypothetical protein U0641_09240 [Anaerolineae bacterium]